MSGGVKEIKLDRQTFEAIRCATVVRESRLWPDPEVANARHILQVQFRSEPTLEQLAEKYGAEAVAAVAQYVIRSRVAEVQQITERLGDGSPCHLCGSPRTPMDPSYEFGLARIIEEKTEWGAAGAALALNLLTLPLGVAVGARPGKSTRANIARCRLVMCASCGKKKTGWFSGLRLGEADCSKHPSWKRLKDEGFHRFLDDRELAKFH